MMRKPALIVCYFACCISFSNAQTITHRDDLVYYVRIAKQVKDVTPDVLNVWGQIRQTLLKAQNSPSHHAEPGDVDNLKNLSAQNLRMLDRAIREVNAMDETDSMLNYKQFVLSFFADIRTTEEQAMSQIILLLNKGVDKINDQQTASIKNFLSRSDDLRVKQQNLDNLGVQYRQRHSISDEELRNNGL